MSTRYKIEFEEEGTGLVMSGLAGEALGKHKLVFAADDSTCMLAEADVDASNPAMGLTLSAAADGQMCEILLLGYVHDSSWSWTIGGNLGVIYVSDTAGELTQSPGSDPYPVAIALSPTSIYFHPSINNFTAVVP